MSKKVLVIDDDNLARKSLALSLQQEGFEVLEAVNGKEGLDMALQSHPDIILTDIRMPEKDGLAMIDELRKDEWGKTVKVIVLSTDEEATTLNQAMQSGVTVYLAKSNTSPDDIAKQVSLSLG